MHLRDAMVAALALLAILTEAVIAGEIELVLVPEMERPPGIVYQPEAVRGKLRGAPDAARGLARLQERVEASWPELRRVDLAALSRRQQADLMRGYELPARPGPLEGQVVGKDESTGRIYIELRGPRLPARYEIVHRYLYFYASFEPASGELGPLVVTIRGWVLE